VTNEATSPYACFEDNPILMVDIDGDMPDGHNENSNDGPDDEYVRYKDGSFRKIGGKGGDIVDYVYFSNKESNCVPCLSMDGEIISKIAIPYRNPAYDDDGNLKLRALDYTRTEPGKWSVTWAQGEEGLGYIDITDAISAKGMLKAGAVFFFKKAIKTQIVKVDEKKVIKETEKKVVNLVANNLEKNKNFVNRLKEAGKRTAAKTRIQLENSVAKVMGKSYKAIERVTVPIKNDKLLNSLKKTSKGSWVKVYEAGMQNGAKIETHYFRNNTTGQVFDVKTKYNYWHQKAFKNIGQ